MENVFSLIISSLSMILTDLYITKKLDRKLNLNFKSFKSILIILVSILLLIINYSYCSNLIKFVVSFVIISFMFKSLYTKEKISKIISLGIICQLLALVSEMIFILGISSIKNLNSEKLITTVFGTVFTNFGVIFIMVLLVNIKYIKDTFISIIEKVELMDEKHLIIGIVSFSTILNFLLFSVYYQLNLISLIFINSILIIFISFITYKILDSKNKLLEEQNKITKYKAENNALINNLNAYERMADQHRVINHENKNQLSTIKQMIQNSDERAIGYIDNLIGASMPDNEKLIDKTKRIPSGGLQGIIYQKMLTMNKLKIKYNLIISRDLKELDFRKLDINTTVDLCKILGVYIDNSIQEVLKLKEKLIEIEIFVEDNKLCVSIANNYGKKVDFSKIDEPGYTTKGKNHGYGLVLVSDILKHNNRLENERRVTPKHFKQIIKVKRMKTNYKKKK